VGDMPVSLQTRLLRVLQEREVLRLGGTEPISIDVRIIAATHQDLRGAIEAGRFRTDLYYRLNILRLRTLPLRERREDIVLIARGIVQRLLVSGQPQGAGTLPAELLPYLMGYAWPGNVRELENIVERAVLSADELARDGEIDEQRLARLIPELFEQWANTPAKAQPASKDLRSLSKAAELDHVRQTLEACGGNMEDAARSLGISRSTLWRRLRFAH
jgi:propionate catabolism operon transcriptional regulator